MSKQRMKWGWLPVMVVTLVVALIFAESAVGGARPALLGDSSAAAAPLAQAQETAGITIRIEIIVLTPEPGGNQPARSGDAGDSGDTGETQGQDTAQPEASPTATTTTTVTAANGEAAQSTSTVAETPAEGETEPEGETPEGEATPAAGVVQGGEDSSASSDEPQNAPGDEAAQSGEQQGAADGQALIEQGVGVYTAYCMACHQEAGEGVEGIYPALAGNPFVTAEDPSQLLEVVLTGRGGMPHFQQYLTTEELAAVISFVRNGWGNSASVISVEQVSEAAEQFGSAAEVVEH